MISDRVQMLAGWTTAPSDQDLNCVCEGRKVPLIRFPYPAPDHPDLTGFGTYLLTQDFLGAADHYLRTEIRASGKILATVPLRFSPIARELARDFPLNQRRYPVAAPERIGKGGTEEPPVVIFPGLASVGGCSLNLLMRLEMIRRGWDFPILWEANDEGLWRRLCERRQRHVRWIDGHACYRAGEPLRSRSVRITLLREPVRRIVSFFNYASVVHPHEFPYPRFDDFVDSGAARRHSQCQILLRFAGLADAESLPDDELCERARQELRSHYCLVGITEYFEEVVFLVARLLGLEDVGMWSRVLASPQAVEVDRLSARQRRRLESELAADIRLYHDQRQLFALLLTNTDFGAGLVDYKRDAANEKRLPDSLKMAECLRWRQVQAEEQLLALRPPRTSPELI